MAASRGDPRTGTQGAPPPGAGLSPALWSAPAPDAVAPDVPPPDVSVIVPVRDTLPWLAACIDGLRAQTGLRVEILVIDDGSRDGSGAWLRAAVDAPGPQPLRLLTLPEAVGQAAARNIGLDAARGRWAAFLDGDDMLAGPEALARWVARADAAGADLALAQFDVLTRAGVRRPGRRTPAMTDARAATHPALADACSCWQLLLRRSGPCGALRFDAQLRQREDRPFVIAALLAARRIAVIEDAAVIHRLRDGSAMTVRDADQLAQYARHLDALEESFRAAAGTDPKPLSRFRAAVETGALAQLMTYWAPLIASLNDAPAVAAALHAAARLARGGGAAALAGLRADDGLPALAAAPDAAVAEGGVDLLRALLRAGRLDAGRRLIAHGRLTLPEILAERPYLPPDGARAAAQALTFDRGASGPALRRGIDVRAAREILAPLDLVLHVGMPKTGSSAFQSWLEVARLDLLDRGVLAPMSGRTRARGARRGRSAGHDLLAAALMRGDPGPLCALAGEVRLAGGAPMVLISAESLLGPILWRGPEGLAALRAMLPFRHVRAIGLHRDPAVWAERMFREMAANPRNGFVEEPEALVRQLALAGLTDPEGLEAALRAAFDSIAFERFEDAGGRAPERLMALAGIAPEGLSLPDPRLANRAVLAGAALAALTLKRAGMPRDVIEALDLDAAPGALRDDAPLLDLHAVRAFLAGGGEGAAPSLWARGHAPGPPDHALALAALGACGAALAQARAALAPAHAPAHASGPACMRATSPARHPNRPGGGGARRASPLERGASP